MSLLVVVKELVSNQSEVPLVLNPVSPGTAVREAASEETLSDDLAAL